MSCPYLREASVRYCHASAIRKLIASGSAAPAEDRCSTPWFRECSIHAANPGASQDALSCPYLQDTLAHFCAASPVRRFIPFTQHAGRCGGEGHRFCELYLALARPLNPSLSPSVPHVRGVAVPTDLHYSPDHLWIHASPNGTCHIGIDAFFAWVIGQVDGVSFAATTGVHRPGATLSVRSFDWPVSFRHALLLDGANVYLRRKPAHLTDDPYGAGWLFEGWELPSGASAFEGLIPGMQAPAWFEHEFKRLDQFVHSLSRSPNDGGTVNRGFIEHLDREETLRLLHEFFAPHQSWRNEH